MAPPIGAPVLVSGADEVPELTSTAIVALGPQGSSETDDAQAFAIGDVATPDDLRVTDVEGANPAEVAAAIEELRAELTGIKLANIVLASSDEAAYAMPAAAWAARSGDPILFVQRDSVPTPTSTCSRSTRTSPSTCSAPSRSSPSRPSTRSRRSRHR